MAKPITITLLGDESDLADSLERSTADVTDFADRVEQALRQATNEAAGLGDAVADGVNEAGDEVGTFGERFGGAAALAGAAIAAGLIAGVTEALDEEKGNDVLAAQLGASPAEAQALGKAAGEIYTSGWGESVADANAALKSLWQEGLVPADATADELADIGKRAMDVATVLGDEVGPTSNAVGQMIKTGLAANAEEAFDLMTVGAQNGANKAEDLADTFNEYSTQFRSMGLTGADAMGLMSQGLQAGARDSDSVADAIKEFSIEAVAGSDKIRKGFEGVGLNADQMFQMIGKGGPSARQALGMTLDSLRSIEDPTRRNALAVELFGTKAEDLAGSLYALDLDTAADGLGEIEGAAQRAGDVMHDNASTRMAEFWRTLKHGAVAVIGGALIPALDWAIDKTMALGGFVEDNKVPLSVVAGVITTLLLPSLIAWAVQSGTTATASVIAWATTSTTAVTGAATQVAAHWAVVGGWIRSAAQAGISAGMVVAGWVLMGAQAMAQAARMAAAWLIAMGPIALIIAAVVGLALLIWTHWDTIKRWTGEAWDWVWNKIKGIWDFLVTLFMNVTLVGWIISHWDAIKTATGEAWDWVWNKIKGLFGWLVDLFLNFTGPGLIIKHWDKIKTATEDAFRAVQDKAREGINAVVGFFTGLPGRIGQAAGRVVGAARGIGGSVVDGLKGGLSNLGGFASSLASAVSGATKGAVNGVVDLLNWAIPDRLGWGSLSIDIPNNPIPHVRAMGGPTRGLTRVGERGPEWVHLPSGSNVVPNHAAPGGGVVVNVRSQADPWAIGREVAWALRTA
ncbi:phage tail tape measure protein [Streptomyces tsukubensis]|uniref:phage tail tape measure protein n=1 Tax=Streptomyces tsukubensis TaxID=83656 RepID=UPI0036BD89C9